MITALLLLATSQTAPITIRSGCERMPVLLAQVSKLANAELRCSPAFEDEVLFVSVKDKPLDLLMKQIAEVCHAEWRKEDGATRLYRSPARVAQDVKEDQTLNLSCIKASLESRIRGAKPAMTAEQETAHLKEMAKMSEAAVAESNSPSMRNQLYDRLRNMGLAQAAINRLFASIDLSTFASQPPWEHRLYAIEPNRYQYPLGPKAAGVIAPFVKEENFLIGTINALDDEKRGISRSTYARNGDYFSPILEPASVFVEGRAYECDHLQLEAMFLDAEGYAIDSAGTNVSLWPDEDPAKSLPDIAKWGAKRLVFSDRTKATINAKAVDSPFGPPDPMAAKPLEKDPLSFIFDEPLSQLSDEAAHGIVAALPDEIARSGAGMVTEEQTLRDLCQLLTRYESVRDEDGTLVITPRKRAQAYSLRAKRKPLQELVAIGRSRPVTVDEAGGYALKQNDFAAVTYLEQMVVNYNQASSRSLEWLAGSLAYREYAKLYASLSPAQRTRIVTEGLRYSELTSHQRDIVDFWTYSCDPHFAVSHNKIDRKRGYFVLDRIGSVCLPDGVPLDTLFTMKLKREKSALLVAPNGGRQIDSCTSIGYVLYQQERGEFGSDLGYKNIASCKLTPATETTYEFDIAYTPQITDGYTLHDAKIESAISVSWKDLPPEWLKPLTDTLEYYRKMNLPSRGHQSPPPPR
jgi:hypothetical protein